MASTRPRGKSKNAGKYGHQVGRPKGTGSGKAIVNGKKLPNITGIYTSRLTSPTTSGVLSPSKVKTHNNTIKKYSDKRDRDSNHKTLAAVNSLIKHHTDSLNVVKTDNEKMYHAKKVIEFEKMHWKVSNRYAL